MTCRVPHQGVLGLVYGSNGSPEVLWLQSCVCRAQVNDRVLRYLQQVPGRCKTCSRRAVKSPSPTAKLVRCSFAAQEQDSAYAIQSMVWFVSSSLGFSPGEASVRSVKEAGQRGAAHPCPKGAAELSRPRCPAGWPSLQRSTPSFAVGTAPPAQCSPSELPTHMTTLQPGSDCSPCLRLREVRGRCCISLTNCHRRQGLADAGRALICCADTSG